jgi:uncharacterized membrane protein YgdD (TMEM256/DUF423 family)
MNRFWLIVAAVSGFLTVALGAFGAHALKNVLDSYGRGIYEKAVQYQMFHTAALLVVGILQHLHPQTSFTGAGWAFFSGLILFSGSLYLLALTGAKWWGAVTPFGGLAFLLGWAWLAYALLQRK